VVGRIDFESTLRVGSELPGQVVTASAGVGDRVKRGQVLARLDNLEQRAAYDAAEAQLALAEVGVTRAEAQLMENLHSSRDWRNDTALDVLLDGPAGKAQLELLAAGARFRKQEASLGLARGLMARRAIRAPVAGVVLARSFERGETITASPPGPPLFVIDARPGRVLLRAEIADNYVVRVQAGPARVTVPALPGQSFVGEVVGVAASDPASGLLRTDARATYEVRLAIDNSDGTLRPGLSATVELPMSSPKSALRVSALAVDRPPGPPGMGATGSNPTVIWAVHGAGPPTPLPAEVGVSDGRFVEIRGPGIDAGQRVTLRTTSP
jgi:HlyD family secretion protein